MKKYKLNPGYIPIEEANTMIQSYQDAKADRPEDLNALIFDADLLRDYLSDESIKNVKFMFAHTLEYIQSEHIDDYSGLNCDVMTAVIAGYDGNGDYVFKDSTYVANHAMPCPRNCPECGTASNNILTLTCPKPPKPRPKPKPKPKHDHKPGKKSEDKKDKHKSKDKKDKDGSGAKKDKDRSGSKHKGDGKN